jgi:hypothetical protein
MADPGEAAACDAALRWSYEGCRISIAQLRSQRTTSSNLLGLSAFLLRIGAG